MYSGKLDSVKGQNKLFRFIRNQVFLFFNVCVDLLLLCETQFYDSKQDTQTI